MSTDDRTVATVARPTTQHAEQTLRPPPRPKRHDPDCAATHELPRLGITLPSGEPPDNSLAPQGSQWLVQGVLGQGGMGKVYLAVQRSLGRKVALKVLEGEGGGPESLLREARVTGGLEHPNIVPVHLLGLDAGGKPAMVMKRIEGVSWTTLLREPRHEAWGRLAVRHPEALGTHLEVLLQVCHAVQYAHARGVVHRDLKPDNVMVGEHGEVYLLDWGIALRLDEREGEADALVGTPAYMAPEMVAARAALVDERTDVYLLGAVLHRVLTGRSRHQGDTIDALLDAAARSEPVVYGGELPEALAALCNEATAREPSMRPPTVGAFRERVTDFLQHRASRALYAQALRELAKLEAPGGHEALAGPEAWQWMVAARFGFMQALREWGDNGPARDGLRRVLELMVERELELANPAGARALLEELASPPSALLARTDALEQAQALEQREAARRALHREELDLSPAPRARNMVLATVTSGIVLFSGALGVRSSRAGTPLEYRQILAADAVILLAALAAMAALRKRVLSNVIGRRLNSVLLLCIVTTIAVDAFSFAGGLPVVHSAVVRCLAIAFVTGVAALLGLPALLLPAGLSAAGAALLFAQPEHAPQLMPVILAVVTLSVAWLVRSGQLRASRHDLPA